MYQIVVISGKGGTGKTSFLASLAVLFESKVIVDADVDAPNLHILLSPQIIEKNEFYGAGKAKILDDTCTYCGKCKEICPFDAIYEKEGKFFVDEISCESCGLCYHFCPSNAITFEKTISGEWFISDTSYGKLVHAHLFPGEENSGLLVSILRQKAVEIAQIENKKFVLIDGPPGIGCPVISAITGVNLAIILTEPTLSAIHDMKRVINVLRHFKIPAGIVINKFDLNLKNTDKILEYCEKEGLKVFGKIPYDDTVYDALHDCKPFIFYDCKAKKSVEEIYSSLQRFWQSGQIP